MTPSRLGYRAILPVDKPAPLLMLHRKIALADAHGQVLSDNEGFDI